MCALVCQGCAESEEVSKDMSKERSSALGTEGRGGSSVKGGGDGSQFRDGSESKKRLDDVVEKPSPSTSKGGIGKEKERLALSTSSLGRRLPAIDSRVEQDKNRYQGEGALICSVSCVQLFILYSICTLLALP